MAAVATPAQDSLPTRVGDKVTLIRVKAATAAADTAAANPTAAATTISSSDTTPKMKATSKAAVATTSLEANLRPAEPLLSH